MLPSRSNSCSCNTRSSFACRPSGHVADFIQKQSASVRRLESSYPLNYSTGERASLMAKQFAFQQVYWNRGAVQLNEWACPAFTLHVDRTRDQFLTRSCFALDENCAGRRADSQDVIQHYTHANGLDPIMPSKPSQHPFRRKISSLLVDVYVRSKG